MRYEDYIANLALLAVELVNDAAPADELLREHGIATPTAGELVPLLKLLRPAMVAVADSGDPGPVNRLLRRYPPRLQISWHDGRRHLHHAEDGEPPVTWLGRSCAAALAHVACGVPEVTIGRCRAAGCPRFFVDQSRNRSRRFCGNACASRTTVAAYRSRRAGSA
jgi:predicted RNA-binding Zn ribbon-like protein